MNEFLIKYWKKQPEEVKHFFHSEALSYLHDSNEVLTVDDWVAHFSELADDWDTTVDRIETLGENCYMTITFHRSPSWNGFVTSIFTINDGKITELHEYYSPCDDNVVPQWREDLKDEEKIT